VTPGAGHAKALNDRLRGRALTPADDGFAGATKLFNAMIDNQPQVAVQVADAGDVVTTVRYAREQGLDLSVRGGGHGVVGEATAGELVIDLSRMGAVTVDPAARTAVVGGGAVWGEVDARTQEHGLAVPAGRVTHTGVAGLTLGGGQGWLSPKHGLTIDNLLSVDLVTADGREVTASATSEPDLFWALRGGGGGFGVVTSFTFRLHPVGPMILGGMIIHPGTVATEVCTAYSDFMAGAPDDLGGAMVFLSAPEAPFVPPEAVGAPIVANVVAWFGDPAEGENVIKPLRDMGKPLVDMVGPMPYVALQSMIDEGNDFGLRQYWSAQYVDALTPALLADTVELALGRPSPLSNVILAPMGAAANRVPEDETAFGHREAGYLFHPLAQWVSPEDDAANVGWAKQLGAAAKPHAGGGTYLNVDSDMTTDRTRFAFGDAAYRRLASVKKAWDPDNVFRHATKIDPNAA
jgi:FAD/FMN-containing dehydrogenase